MARGREQDKRSERSHVWEVCPHAFMSDKRRVSIKKQRARKVILAVLSIRKKLGDKMNIKTHRCVRWWWRFATLWSHLTFTADQLTLITSLRTSIMFSEKSKADKGHCLCTFSFPKCWINTQQEDKEAAYFSLIINLFNHSNWSCHSSVTWAHP